MPGYSSTYPDQLGRMELVVPRFQRNVVWDAEQQRAYAQAVFDCALLASPIVIWEPRGPLERRLVIDGLQRLTALDVPLTRDDGAAHPRAPLALNVLTGRVEVAPAEPPRFTLRDIATGRYQFMAPLYDLGDRALIEAVHCAIVVSQRARLVLLTVEGSADDAIAVMRGVNQPGVPYDLDELAANLRATAAEYGATI